MHRFPLLLLFPVVAAACLIPFLPTLPEPITDAEVEALGIDQGIAGRAAYRGGDCMPGCGIRDCYVSDIPQSLVVLAAQPALVVPYLLADAGGPRCTPAAPGRTGTPLPSEPAVIASVQLTGTDTYALSLDPGEYQIALVDESGCAWCDRYTADADAGMHCQTVEVRPGEVTRRDVLMDVAGY